MPKIAILRDDITGEALNVGMTARNYWGTVVIDSLLPFEGAMGKVRCINSENYTLIYNPSDIGAHFEYSD